MEIFEWMQNSISKIISSHKSAATSLCFLCTLSITNCTAVTVPSVFPISLWMAQVLSPAAALRVFFLCSSENE